MNKVILFVLLGISFAVSPLWADDVDLDRDARTMDTDTTNQPARAQNLADRFGVPVERVNNLRDSGKGWGAIRIELALAERLTQNHPETYPTTNDALTKVTAMRGEGRGYGVIAKDLGLKVGDVQRASKMDRPDKPAKIDKPGKPEKVGKPDRPDHPNKPGR